ncbi:MAG TPA: hypothetical protein VMK42_15810, partial [Anaeromyxobacteraceae bacterium]|nr:hypothetical protein [Anaeromyxobacteraceae bacterium]
MSVDRDRSAPPSPAAAGAFGEMTTGHGLSTVSLARSDPPGPQQAGMTGPLAFALVARSLLESKDE